jgi:putative Mg2+ transporter-C (MgtC) family protein
MEFLSEAFTFDLKQIVIDFLRIAIAFLIAVPIGWERLQSERSLGLRTFPIVAIGACGFVLITKQISGSNAESEARIIAGLLSGIGFIGGGAILKKGGNVRGLATASSIWVTGAIGAAVALGREEIALILSLITFCTLRMLTPIVQNSNSDNDTSREESEKNNEN